uniref:YeeE/YedE thiosulfate transporter family protein n=1 Tax=Roseovarius halophilus (ex Wu et al. 2025) TaxID=3376060 RepID=UPI00399BDEC4
GHGAAAVLAAVALVLSVILAWRRRTGLSRSVAAAFVGLAVALGWVATYSVSIVSFEIIPVSSVTFTGPSTDTLMGLVNSTTLPPGFGVGLVPGVFAGSALAAILSREFSVQRFGTDTPMERYLVGAVLMGFGAMLAGGCAVGAGMSGGAVFAVTAWVAVFCMWLGAMATHVALQRMGMTVARGQPAE